MRSRRVGLRLVAATLVVLCLLAAWVARGPILRIGMEETAVRQLRVGEQDGRAQLGYTDWRMVEFWWRRPVLFVGDFGLWDRDTDRCTHRMVVIGREQRFSRYDESGALVRQSTLLDGRPDREALEAPWLWPPEAPPVAPWIERGMTPEEWEKWFHTAPEFERSRAALQRGNDAWRDADM